MCHAPTCHVLGQSKFRLLEQIWIGDERKVHLHGGQHNWRYFSCCLQIFLRPEVDCSTVKVSRLRSPLSRTSGRSVLLVPSTTSDQIRSSACAKNILFSVSFRLPVFVAERCFSGVRFVFDNCSLASKLASGSKQSNFRVAHHSSKENQKVKLCLKIIEM